MKKRVFQVEIVKNTVVFRLDLSNGVKDKRAKWAIQALKSLEHHMRGEESEGHSRAMGGGGA